MSRCDRFGLELILVPLPCVAGAAAAAVFVADHDPARPDPPLVSRVAPAIPGSLNHRWAALFGLPKRSVLFCGIPAGFERRTVQNLLGQPSGRAGAAEGRGGYVPADAAAQGVCQRPAPLCLEQAETTKLP